MINKINYVLLNAVYSYTIIKCYTIMLEHHHLTMRGILVSITIDKTHRET